MLDLLDGLRVVSFNHFLLGPMGIQMLGDLGADVIAVESPEGAWQRHWSSGDIWPDGQSALHLCANRNKRSVAIDLKSPQGLELALRLIDTAGIRRRGRIAPGIEKYSVLRAMRAIDRADVAILVLDADEGVAAQDAHVASYIQDAAKGVVLVLNKWDLVEKNPRIQTDYTQQVRRGLQFLDYAPLLFVSAKTVQSWEQGTRVPSRAARRLIQIFTQRPGVVCEVVGLRSVQLAGFRIVELKPGKRRIVKQEGDVAASR